MAYSSEVEQLKLEIRESKLKAGEIDRLNMAYSSEVEQLKFEVRESKQKAGREIERLNLAYSSEVEQLKLEVRESKQKAGREIERLNLAYSSEVEQLKLEVGDLKSQNELLVARYKAEVAEYKAELAEYKTKIELSDCIHESAEKCLQQEKELSGTLTESLQKKDGIIVGMKEQLTKTRNYLTANKQPVSSYVHPGPA
jgi:hypothetical protein